MLEVGQTDRCLTSRGKVEAHKSSLSGRTLKRARSPSECVHNIHTTGSRDPTNMESISRRVPPMPSCKPPPLPKGETDCSDIPSIPSTAAPRESAPVIRKPSSRRKNVRHRPASINAFVRVQPNLYVVHCPAGGTGVRLETTIFL